MVGYSAIPRLYMALTARHLVEVFGQKMKALDCGHDGTLETTLRLTVVKWYLGTVDEAVTNFYCQDMRASSTAFSLIVRCRRLPA